MTKCSFCDKEMLPGTGTLYVKRDATAYWFCSSKCEKNQLKLKRTRRKTRWTSRYHENKKIKASASEKPKQGKGAGKKTAKKGKRRKK